MMYTEDMETTTSFLDEDKNGIPDLIQAPAHDHGSVDMVLGSGITEMNLMWALMGLMLIHHTWMFFKMRSTKVCTCKRR
jgi:hypothetical protein